MPRIAYAALVIAALPAGAWAADTTQVSPADKAAAMMVAYQDACLGAFPNAATLDQLMAAEKAEKLDDAAARAALLGHQGVAWTVTGAKAKYVVALEAPPAARCVVTGQAAEGEGVRTLFTVVVTSFVKGRDIGPLQTPPVQQGNIGGRPATLQIIGASGQAFVNMGVANEDGSTQLRLTREFAPR